MAAHRADGSSDNRSRRRSGFQGRRNFIEQSSQSPIGKDGDKGHQRRNGLPQFLIQGICDGTKEHNDVRQKQNQDLGELFDSWSLSTDCGEITQFVLVEVRHSKGNNDAGQHKRADHLRICHYFNHGGVSSRHDQRLA